MFGMLRCPAGHRNMIELGRPCLHAAACWVGRLACRPSSDCMFQSSQGRPSVGRGGPGRGQQICQESLVTGLSQKFPPDLRAPASKSLRLGWDFHTSAIFSDLPTPPTYIHAAQKIPTQTLRSILGGPRVLVARMSVESADLAADPILGTAVRVQRSAGYSATRRPRRRAVRLGSLALTARRPLGHRWSLGAPVVAGGISSVRRY
eukprot:COSAG01_NODE_410_length_17384_cov_20.323691_13_plen_205_part_00